MALARPLINRGGVTAEFLAPGDRLAGGESVNALTTAVGDTWTGSLIARGIIRRSGPGAGYTDTTDTAQNILNSLTSAGHQAVSLNGSTFRLLVQNTVAFALTFAAGTGVVAGTGTLDIAASLVREYLLTILNSTPQISLQSNTTNANPTVTFVLPPGLVAYPIGPAPNAVTVTPGMGVSGTGISAGTTVLGVTQGQGGVVGVTLSANATATSEAGGTPLTFFPRIQIDSLRSSTL